MLTTIGVCGYFSTGSSAVIDLLKEFDGVNALDNGEFLLAYYPDGLEDLEYHLLNPHKIMISVVAIARFRKFVKFSTFQQMTGGKINKAADEFLNKIVQFSFDGFGGLADSYLLPSWKIFARKCAAKISRGLKCAKIFEFYTKLASHKIELSLIPENFDSAAKEFIAESLDSIGYLPSKINVVNQAFEACDPVKSFKYFDNPRAILVDRDPRDHYLFTKIFLQPRGLGNSVPCNNIDDYIRYYKLLRSYPEGLHSRNDVMFINFEELIYDYENAVKRVADFCEVSEHIHKSEYFKPTHSRSNSQLFKKYTDFKEDIEKIERELSEYLFHFEDYPDIEPEDGMFFGSQSRKWR